MNVLRQLFSRRKLYDDLSGEIRAHLDERTEELMASGMQKEDATAQARREFGNVLLTEERGREVWKWPTIESFFADVRFGLRLLRRSPGFTMVAVLTLALGIGANTAIFSVVNTVLLRELPVSHPEQLVFLTNPDVHGMGIGFGDGDRNYLTYPEFQQLERSNTVFSGLLAVSSETHTLPVEIATPGQAREPFRVNVSLVSGSYFGVLGVTTVIGHTFSREVDRVRDANPVAVISYRFWQSQFAGASSVLGRIVRIHETSFDIIGVLPRQFRGETIGAAPDVWVPLSMQPEVFPGRDYLSLETNPFHKTEWLEGIGRLKPGATLQEAKAAINVNFEQLLESQAAGMSAQDKKEFLNQHLAISEGSHGGSILRAGFAKPLRVLMAIVGLILLIACANIANILLSRSAARQREITVRIAMGAGAGRLFRQVLTESVLLGLIGGAAGLMLSHWLDIALLRMVSSGPAQIPLDVHPDRSILLFTFGISLFTGILCGLAPALRATHVDLDSVLRGMSRTVTGGHGGRVPLGKSLVVVQVAVSLLLVVMAGLFVRSFQRLAEVELGYDRDHVLTFSTSPLSYGYKGPAIRPLYTAMLERLGAIPGVRSASLIDNGLFAESDSNSPVRVEGERPKAGDQADCWWDLVGPNFFSAAGIPILYGRDITPEDTGGRERVGVVNEEFVHYYLARGTNPIGKRVRVMTTEGDSDFVIVGVAATAKQKAVRERPRRRFYVPFFNPVGDASSAWLIVRTAGDPAQAESAVRSAVRETAANLPPPEIQTMKEVVGETLATDRMITQLSTAFGGLAVVLACIGLYGVMAYVVSGRINEIGIRIALGAQRSRLLWLILRESLLLVVIGTLIGLPAVFAAGKWVSSLLFGVVPADPGAMATSLVLMFLVGAIACYVPARRAMRVDPIAALRHE